MLVYILLANNTGDLLTPQFIGPVNSDDPDVEYYFICRVVYNHTDVELTFDVTLLFDGEAIPRLAFKTVTSSSSFDVMFTPQDFVQQYGKLVCISLHSAASYRTRNCTAILSCGSAIHSLAAYVINSGATEQKLTKFLSDVGGSSPCILFTLILPSCSPFGNVSVMNEDWVSIFLLTCLKICCHSNVN